ncbi:MAG: alpha/beta hydrolase [Lysobacteraceae bacterium]|nr:MAG: alpha/beta hydrolase [Xanthomonadaceae bacterium]
MRSAVLVHGAGGGAWEWNLWRPVLAAAGWEVDALELQPAAAGVAATSLQDYIDQVTEAVEGMPRPRAVIGASLGGLLAVACAGKADALVLVNPLPPAPWHLKLPARQWDDVVGWRRNARLPSTRDAMPDADDASAMYAFRHWRDESGQVMRQASAGFEVAVPRCPALFVVSHRDEAIAPDIISAWSTAWEAELMETIATSHVGPLLGSQGPSIALQAVAWLNRQSAFR